MHRSNLLILAGQDKLLWHLTSEPGDPPGCFHQSEATLKTRRRVLQEAMSGKLWQPLAGPRALFSDGCQPLPESLEAGRTQFLKLLCPASKREMLLA